jgi:hypothetical protein
MKRTSFHVREDKSLASAMARKLLQENKRISCKYKESILVSETASSNIPAASFRNLPARTTKQRLSSSWFAAMIRFFFAGLSLVFLNKMIIKLCKGYSLCAAGDVFVW